MDGGGTPLYDFSLLCIILVWTIFFSSFSHALGACGIPSLGMHLLFLFVQPIHFDDNSGER